MATTESTGKSLAGTTTDEPPISPRTVLADLQTEYLLIDHCESWDAFRTIAEASEDTIHRVAPIDC